MKIMFLNVTNLEVEKPLEKYIKEKSGEIDVFCFQEAYYESEKKLENWLPDYDSRRNEKTPRKINRFTQKTFSKKEIKIIESATLLYNYPDMGLALHTKVKHKDKVINICNVHGKAFPGDKLDNPGRIKQSQNIIDFYKSSTDPVIIGGDFNLELKTRSVNIFKDYGYANLIEKYNVKTTRNHLVWDLWPETPQYYADHIFISPVVKVKSFLVDNVEVSDHLPIILEI